MSSKEIDINETNYLIDGTEVNVKKILSEGYIINRVWYDNEDDVIEGHDEFVDVVFSAPPTERVNEKIIELGIARDKIQEEIALLEKQKREVMSTIDRAKAKPLLKTVLSYLLCDFKYVMSKKHLEIREANSVYTDLNNYQIKVREGVANLQIGKYGDEPETLVFQTKEDAELSRKELFMSCIVNANWGHSLDEIEKWRDQKDLLELEDVKSAIATKRIELSEKYKEGKIKEAREKIESANKTLSEYGLNT